jgi:hypothetical protein
MNIIYPLFSDRIKKILVCLIALGGLWISNAHAQETFVFKGDPGTTNLKPYAQALTKAQMEPYRLRNSRTTLKFENEIFTVELLSAKELIESGKKIALSDYPEVFPKTFEMPVFSISADGWLLARYSNKYSKFH